MKKGIVYSGLISHFYGALVSIKRIRDLDVKLPIEFFTESQLNLFPKNVLEEFNIKLKKIEIDYKCKFSNKLHSIINSDLDEILFVDSDVLFIDSPNVFFKDYKYKQFGNLFWRDIEPNYKGGCYKTDSGVFVLNKKSISDEFNNGLDITEQNYNTKHKGDKEVFRKVLNKIIHNDRIPDLIGFEDDNTFYGCSMLHYYLNKPLFIHSTLMKFHFDINQHNIWSHIAIVDDLKKIKHRKSKRYNRFFPSLNNYDLCETPISELNNYLIQNSST